MTAVAPVSSWVLTSGFMALAAAVGIVAGVEPALAIAGAFAVGFVLLALADLTAGLVAFILLAFLEFLFAGTAISLTKVAGLVLVLSWFAAAMTSDRPTLLSAHPALFFTLLAFLSWAALSAIWSADPGETGTELTRYLSVIALFVITYTAVTERRHAKWVFGAFLAGTAATAAYGLATRPDGGTQDSIRIGSTVGDPNTLAMILVAGLVLALAAVAANRVPLIRLGACVVAALCVVAFVLAGSRGGIVSLAVALIAAVVIAGRWRPQVALGATCVSIVAVLMFVAFAPPEIKDRINETTSGQIRSSEGRATLWEVGWRMVEDRPAVGVGLGSFQSSSVEYLGQPGALGRTDQIIDRPLVAHNLYLQSLAETGIVGAALLLSIPGFSIGCCVAASRNFARAGDREMELMTRALVVAVMGFLAGEFFVSEPFNKLLWLLLGLGPAMLAISRSTVGDGHRSLPTDSRTPIVSKI